MPKSDSLNHKYKVIPTGHCFYVVCSCGYRSQIFDKKHLAIAHGDNHARENEA